MEKRRTKLIAFGLSIGQSVCGLIALLLLARFEGASSAYALYSQVAAFTLTMTAILGIEASRHQMVHWRLNREPDQARDMIRALFSMLVVSRGALGLLFLFAPSALLSLLTNMDAAVIDQERDLVRLLGAEQVGQLLLDIALFAGITRGWRISAPATAFVIYFLRVLGLLLVRENALFASIAAMLVGEVLGAAYLLWRCFGKEELALTKIKLAPRALVAGLRIALPTSLLGFFPAFLLWGRNYLLVDRAGEEVVALFAYVQPLLMTVGLVFAITLNTSEGILVSDRTRPLEERRAMVLSGFITGLTWALGSALIVAVLAPWIVRVAFSFGSQDKISPQDLETLAMVLRWMCGLIGGATLYAFAVKVAMGLAQNKRFFAINAVFLLLGGAAILLFAHDELAIPITALVSGLLSLFASVVFFLRVGAWSLRDLGARMRRPLLALFVVAILAYLTLFFELEARFVGQSILDLLVLAVVGTILLGVYLGVAWGPKLRRRGGA